MKKIVTLLLVFVLTACGGKPEPTTGPVQGPPAPPIETALPTASAPTSCAGAGMIELMDGQSLPVLGNDGFTIIGKVTRVGNDLVYDAQGVERDRKTVQLHENWSMEMLVFVDGDGNPTIVYTYIVCDKKIFFPDPNPDGSA